MKYIALIPLVLVASCASRRQVVVRPSPPPAVESVEAVRYPEVVRAYHLGRYVDPNHPESMHEQHPVYRLEVSPRWNLHPGQITGGLLNPPPDAAFAPPPTDDALVAEMNRQREATTRVMAETVRLSSSFADLQKIFSEMKAVARDNALVNARVAHAEQRVAEIAKELEKLTTTPVPPTNDVPAQVAAPVDPSIP